MNNGRYATLHAKIDTASSGSQAMVAAVTGKQIVLLNYVMVADGAVTITWQSASTALSGAMSLAANSGIAVNSGGDGLLTTAAGEALNLSLGGSVGIRGHLTYTLL